jgi:glycosyltransferase involved in cell wall biosynthesis
MIGFLVATYNEEAEILTLLTSVSGLVDFFVISDDGSTDKTLELAKLWAKENDREIHIIEAEHIGLPETVKKRGVELISKEYGPDCWVVMLDADERIQPIYQDKIDLFVNSQESLAITHVWFGLQEYIDNVPTRGFEKCRMFRAGAAKFSESVHEDDHFDGQGAAFGWVVIHRKTKDKQILREKEYLQTYKRLLSEGKVTQEWVDRCVGFHYFVRE